METVIRRSMLLLAILMSGGLLLFPRGLMIVLFFVLGSYYLSSRVFLLLRRNLYVQLWLLVLAVITILRPGGLSIDALLPRILNFAAAITLLNIYMSSGAAALRSDLLALLRPMAWQAVLTVPVALLAPSIFIPIVINEVEYRSFCLILTYHITIEEASLFVRPDGFFFEPGVFQIYLNIFLFLVLGQSRSWRARALALGAVASTQSTTGLVIAALLLVAHVTPRLWRASTGRKVVLAPLIAMLAVGFGSVVYDNVNRKLFGELQGSAAAREYDLLTGLAILQEHPWIGIGFNHDDYRAEAARLGVNADALGSDDQAEGRSTSNGLVYMFYSVGVPMGLVLMYGFFRQPFMSPRGHFGLLLTLSLIGEALTLTPFFLLFSFAGLVVQRYPSINPAHVARL